MLCVVEVGMRVELRSWLWIGEKPRALCGFKKCEMGELGHLHFARI